MHKNLVFLLVCCCASPLLCVQYLYAQHGHYDTIRVGAYITPAGDTIPEEILDPVYLITKQSVKSRNYWMEWTRLRNAVYITYPYAKAAGITINKINAALAGVTNKKARKAIIHQHEKELRKAFEGKVTQLSVYQGKILMKLIYRQTGNSCYEILDDYKGWLSAIAWQGVALLFGGNLKQTYDATGEDTAIETIVQDVEVMYGDRPKN